MICDGKLLCTSTRQRDKKFVALNEWDEISSDHRAFLCRRERGSGSSIQVGFPLNFLEIGDITKYRSLFHPYWTSLLPAKKEWWAYT